MEGVHYLGLEFESVCMALVLVLAVDSLDLEDLAKNYTWAGGPNNFRGLGI